MKLSRPTFHIKTRQELTRRESLKAHMRKLECLKAHMRKLECLIRDLLHGGPSRVSNPPTGHSTAYEKFVMDKHMKVENI